MQYPCDILSSEKDYSQIYKLICQIRLEIYQKQWYTVDKQKELMIMPNESDFIYEDYSEATVTYGVLAYSSPNVAQRCTANAPAQSG